MLILLVTATPVAFADDGTATGSDVTVTDENTTTQEDTIANDENATEEDANVTEGNTEVTEGENTEVAEPIVKIVKLTIVVKAKATGKGSIVVKWNRIKGSKGYVIYRSTKKNGTYKKVYSTKKASKNSWTDKSRKLKRNKIYYYKVKPRNLASLTKKVVVKEGPATDSTDATTNTTSRKGRGSRATTNETTTKTTMTSTAKADASLAATGSAKSDSTKAKVKNVIKGKKSFKVKSTAYSGGGHCANGKKVGVGRIAVDPRVIPLGTWVYVDGYGLAQACDTGGAIKGKKIDLYFKGGERKCGSYGVRTVRIFIL